MTMRKKAEIKIREAVAQIGGEKPYRLDRVRVRAGLYPKVFDKTILDMERVGTIRLYAATQADALSRDEISRLVHRGETVYISFEFIDGTDPAAPALIPPAPENPPLLNVEPRVIILDGLGMNEWGQFENLCDLKEGKRPEEKIKEMIREFIEANG